MSKLDKMQRLNKILLLLFVPPFFGGMILLYAGGISGNCPACTVIGVICIVIGSISLVIGLFLEDAIKAERKAERKRLRQRR